jgi:NADH dehydrogenase FAD-containing subunit
VLDNGQTIHFDKVIIASGSRYPTLPLAKSANSINIYQRNRELLNYNNQLKNASRVLIIGGGVVGVELAGEIAYAMPDTDVTLAHRSSTLLDSFKPKAQKKALKQLVELGVYVQFNTQYDEIKNDKERKVYRDAINDNSIEVDMAFIATGTLPNNSFLKQHLSHVFNERGLIKVNSHLEVEGQDNFYAIGDIADVGEAKLGYLAVEQGKYLAKAVAKSLKNRPVKSYKRNPFMALVPTGQKIGVVQLPFMFSTWRGLVNMKQKDLFISKTYNKFSK